MWGLLVLLYTLFLRFFIALFPGSTRAWLKKLFPCKLELFSTITKQITLEAVFEMFEKFRLVHSLILIEEPRIATWFFNYFFFSNQDSISSISCCCQCFEGLRKNFWHMAAFNIWNMNFVGFPNDWQTKHRVKSFFETLDTFWHVREAIQDTASFFKSYYIFSVAQFYFFCWKIYFIDIFCQCQERNIRKKRLLSWKCLYYGESVFEILFLKGDYTLPFLL